MKTRTLFEERLTHSVIGAFFEVYNHLGYGFLEHVCVLALEKELIKRGHEVLREVAVPIAYKGEPLATHRIDLIVDGRLIVETKAAETLHGSASRQLYNYLRATGITLGLLLYFGPKPYFKRVEYQATATIPSIQLS